jgi:hypothetical protein
MTDFDDDLVTCDTCSYLQGEVQAMSKRLTAAHLREFALVQAIDTARQFVSLNATGPEAKELLSILDKATGEQP